MANKDFWISVLKRIKPTIKWAHFLTWFQSTAVMEIKEGRLIVGVPTSFARDWIANKYEMKLMQAAVEVDDSIKTIDYEVHGRLAEAGNCDAVDLSALFVEDSGKKVRKLPNRAEVKVSRGGGTTHISSQMLNERYTLDSFIVGKDNRLPHAACHAVAGMPGGIYNPLYIYGGVGMGKTHLIQSIGNEVLKSFPDLVVQYMTAERFVTEVVDAIGKRYMKKFKEKYRNVDCFLMDDVQFFVRKDSSQQEFFHTFNELYDNNKQIVLTSDRAPAELDELDERLKSRFGMGMVVELLAPDFETRLAILNQKCAEFRILIDPEVLSFIATNLHGSVRDLEGILRQLVAESELNETVPTIRTAAEIIRRLNKAQKIIGYDIEAKRTDALIKNAREVMQIVAEFYNITTDDLMGNDRHKEIMVPRQICMYLIKNELGESYEKIGLNFGGRNHTTVMHACSTTVKRLRKDVRLVRDVNAIKREMGL